MTLNRYKGQFRWFSSSPLAPVLERFLTRSSSSCDKKWVLNSSPVAVPNCNLTNLGIENLLPGKPTILPETVAISQHKASLIQLEPRKHHIAQNQLSSFCVYWGDTLFSVLTFLRPRPSCRITRPDLTEVPINSKTAPQSLA